MSKIIRTRKPSVLPYYAAALVFVVLCAELPVYPCPTRSCPPP